MSTSAGRADFSLRAVIIVACRSTINGDAPECPWFGACVPG